MTKKRLIIAILLSYALWASTFSHMEAMAHPSAHGSMNMETWQTSSHQKIQQTDDEKECTQICHNIEQSKISLAGASFSLPSTSVPLLSLFLLRVSLLSPTPDNLQYTTHAPPGEFAFSELHLAPLATTVLTL